jgi:hypothetical protein
MNASPANAHRVPCRARRCRAVVLHQSPRAGHCLSVCHARAVCAYANTLLEHCRGEAVGHPGAGGNSALTKRTADLEQRAPAGSVHISSLCAYDHVRSARNSGLALRAGVAIETEVAISARGCLAPRRVLPARVVAGRLEVLGQQRTVADLSVLTACALSGPPPTLPLGRDTATQETPSSARNRASDAIMLA